MKEKQDPPVYAAALRRRAESRLSEKQKSQRPAAGDQPKAEETARLVHELQVHQIELEMQNEELMQARATAIELLARYTDLYDFAPAGYLTLDREGAIRQVNLTGAQMLGVERSRLANRCFGLFVVESDRRVFSDYLQKVFASHTRESCELTLLREGLQPLVVRIEAVRSADGQECRSVVLDITERKQAEAKIRAALQEKTALLGEKEALLKEVHHRVKNNLQVISSLLSLEARRHLEPATQSVLKEMQGRIRSMAVLHETLYRAKNFARVDLAGYLREVAVKLFRAQNADPAAVRLVLELTTAEVELDQAMPCGLLLNELLTNTLKHGFPDGRHGEVRLGLQQTADGRVHLQVSDDGVGLSADLDLKNAQTLGLQLVTDLTKQLRGTLEIGPGPGASFSIVFTPKAAAGTTSPLQPAGPGTTGAATPSPG